MIFLSKMSFTSPTRRIILHHTLTVAANVVFGLSISTLAYEQDSDVLSEIFDVHTLLLLQIVDTISHPELLGLVFEVFIRC
jgi:hypothetical protein